MLVVVFAQLDDFDRIVVVHCIANRAQGVQAMEFVESGGSGVGVTGAPLGGSGTGATSR